MWAPQYLILVQALSQIMGCKGNGITRKKKKTPWMVDYITNNHKRV